MDIITNMTSDEFWYELLRADIRAINREYDPKILNKCDIDEILES